MGLNEDILGKGPAWPWQRDGAGKWPMAEKEELVAMGLRQYILTSIGTRPMQKDKGHSLNKLLFSLEGEGRDAAILLQMTEDLVNFEPRIAPLAVSVFQGSDLTQAQRDQLGIVLADNELYVSVDYKVIDTNNELNMVVPVGTTEGVRE